MLIYLDNKVHMHNKAILKLCFDEGQVEKIVFIFHVAQHHHHT
jgi:hypothetical protein